MSNGLTLNPNYSILNDQSYFNIEPFNVNLSSYNTGNRGNLFAGTSGGFTPSPSAGSVFGKTFTGMDPMSRAGEIGVLLK